MNIAPSAGCLRWLQAASAFLRTSDRRIVATSAVFCRQTLTLSDATAVNWDDLIQLRECQMRVARGTWKAPRRTRKRN